MIVVSNPLRQCQIRMNWLDRGDLLSPLSLHWFLCGRVLNQLTTFILIVPSFCELSKIFAKVAHAFLSEGLRPLELDARHAR